MKAYNRNNNLGKVVNSPVMHLEPQRAKRLVSVFWKATMKHKGFRETLRTANA